MHTMKINIVHMFCIISPFLLFLYLQPESLIIVPIAYEPSLKHAYKLLLKPEKQAYLIVKKISSRSSVAGILATYAGYLSTSNNYGEIIFSRHQQEAPLYLAITPVLQPIMRGGTNVDHWEFSKTEQISFFRIDISLNQKNNGFLVFSITEEPIPTDFVVPYPTITIFAKPTYFDVPLGTFESPLVDHWILPTLSLKKDIFLQKNSLLVLPFLQFFEPIQMKVKKESKRNTIRIQN